MTERGPLADGALLSVGTLTALRVPPPSQVDRSRAAIAMAVAPLAVLPVAAVVGATGWVGAELELNPFAVGFAMIAALALGSRALHLDGLSDVADGLTSGHDRERSLAAMKDSAAGPAGVAALVLVLGLQATAAGGMLSVDRGAWLVAVLICASRAPLALACVQGVPAARSDGLAVSFAGSVPRLVALVVGVVAAAAAAGIAAWAGLDWWRGAVAVAVGLVAAAIVLWRCVSRFGGVTGDVFGAMIEVSLAAMLLAV